MLPQAAKWDECSSGTPTLPYHAIVQQGSEALDAAHQSAAAQTRGMQERAPSTRTEKVGQILDTTARANDPGFYAAFPWGGYAQSKGDAPSTARPPITLPGGCLRPSWK